MAITKQDKLDYINSLKKSASGKRAYAKSKKHLNNGIRKHYNKEAEVIEWTCKVLCKEMQLGAPVADQDVEKLAEDLVVDLIFKYNIKIDSFDKEILKEAFENKINKLIMSSV